ncbi:MAG: rod shape-determining protein MreD [Ruminococcaceae bacterium]|nr:rod shape-determining protein MreD [Oscillospiraceae bacterium]
MGRTAKYIILSILIAICEMTFAKYIAVGAAVPMLSFCFVILGAMNEKNPEKALVFGLLVGLLSDTLSGRSFGTYTFVYAVTAVETVLFCDSILSSRFLFLMINTFVMTVFAECVYFLFNIIHIGAGAFWSSLVNIILPTALYNMIISAIFYKPISKVFYERR